MNNLIKNQNGGTAIFMLILMISSFLAVTLTMSDLIVNGFKMDRTQLESTKAYFAAESGAEQILWEVRKDFFNPSCGNNDDKYCYDAGGALIDCDNPCDGGGESNDVILSNQAEYSVSYFFDSPTTTLTSIGVFDDVERVIELSY